jgi:hypothetical protein
MIPMTYSHLDLDAEIHMKLNPQMSTILWLLPTLALFKPYVVLLFNGHATGTD